MKARVLIRPKEGILDPQGQAVARALPALGFDGVSEVRVGRLVELELEDGEAGRLQEMCEKLLANPLVEDYEVVLLTDEPGPGRRREGPAGEPREGPADQLSEGPPHRGTPQRGEASRGRREEEVRSAGRREDEVRSAP